MTRNFLPTTNLGKWGLATLLVAVIALAISMGISFTIRATTTIGVPNMLGPLVSLFLLLSFVGAVMSWVAVGKSKDRSIVLIAAALLATVGLVLLVVGEVLEAFVMGG